MCENVSDFKEILEKSGKLTYKARGVSMLPLIRQNRDIFVIEKKGDAKCKRLDVVIFLRPNGQYVLHRILKVRPDDYWIVGDNCLSGEYVREEQVLGVMTAIKRNNKVIKATDFGYRIYSHLWGDFYPVRFFLTRTYHFVLRCGSFVKRRVLHLHS